MPGLGEVSRGMRALVGHTGFVGSNLRRAGGFDSMFNSSNYRDIAGQHFDEVVGGWASNSKYPFLGGLRSAAQMISYEVSLGLIIIGVLISTGSLNLSRIVEAQHGSWGLFNWFWLPHLPMVFLFFISSLAETNRPPFDLPEAEAELVAGYQVEYSSTPFLLFMIGELMSVVFMCALISILFFGGWLSPIPGVPGRAAVDGGEDGRLLLHLRHGQGDRAALPLRPADADRLEGVPAAQPGVGGVGGDLRALRLVLGRLPALGDRRLKPWRSR